MAKRIVTKIGDVFCVEVDNAYKRYFQYFCSDMSQLNSSVIRVFKKKYPMEYKPKLEEIVKDDVDFYAHTILRDGIEYGYWYKVGKIQVDFASDLETPIFGTCQSSIYQNGNCIDVDPNTNWYLWRINQPHVNVGTLPEQYRDVVESGGVLPSEEIADRIKLGYYRWNSPAYNSLRRRPYPDVDSYIKKEMDDKTIYLHFKGEHVVQKIEIDKNGISMIEEGNPLQLPLFWETNWDLDEFITINEFAEAWEKYT